MGENLRTDVLIVGGGLVGGTLACALADGGLTSIVIDRSSSRHQNTRSFDGRATAVAQSAKRMLTVIGIWSNLKGKVAGIIILAAKFQKSLKLSGRMNKMPIF